MAIKDDKLNKAPFPWFGGKRNAAPVIWAALGDCPHYVEPFAGSLAVLLCRPHLANRPYYSETVNDLDAWVVNFWRALQAEPEAVADAASWPVSELDLHARHLALLKWCTDERREELGAQPELYDAKIAGWWAWGVSCSISGIGNHNGPWVERDGKLFKQDRPKKGAAREPGISREVPHLGDDGKGVNHAGLREPGLGEPHPPTMPELLRWLQFLSARLRHVRIICGDWKRALGSGASLTLPVRQGKGPCGVFLDPPYAYEERSGQLYSTDSGTVSHEVRAWCLEHGQDARYRIVLAGYGSEHDELLSHGWRVVEWQTGGFLKGGYNKEQAKRDRLWLSPHCLTADQAPDEGGIRPGHWSDGFVLTPPNNRRPIRPSHRVAHGLQPELSRERDLRDNGIQAPACGGLAHRYHERGPLLRRDHGGPLEGGELPRLLGGHADTCPALSGSQTTRNTSIPVVSSLSNTSLHQLGMRLRRPSAPLRHRSKGRAHSLRDSVGRSLFSLFLSVGR